MNKNKIIFIPQSNLLNQIMELDIILNIRLVLSGCRL